VVQARAGRSGAMSMARSTVRMGRPLLAVPHPPWSRQGAGCATLLAQGATPIASIDDAVAQLVATIGARQRWR
jgi:predicted Rossmann fold nucleotide-binding protein DprA/Smf involved in DNA uptake